MEEHNRVLYESYKASGMFHEFQLREIELGLEQNLAVGFYADPIFSAEQMAEIRLGLEHRIDVSIYATNWYQANQMKEIRLGLERNLDIAFYDDSSYPSKLMELIRLGLLEELNVNWYSNPVFTIEQATYIFEGLKAGVDVSLYANPGFRAEQMLLIKAGLEKNLNAALYADYRYSLTQMTQIKNGLEEGIDVSLFANLCFTDKQMWEIRTGLCHGVDVSVYAKPEFSAEQMREIRLGIISGIDYSLYADPSFTWDEMRSIRIIFARHKKPDGKAMYRSSRVIKKPVSDNSGNNGYMDSSASQNASETTDFADSAMQEQFKNQSMNESGMEPVNTPEQEQELPMDHEPPRQETNEMVYSEESSSDYNESNAAGSSNHESNVTIPGSNVFSGQNVHPGHAPYGSAPGHHAPHQGGGHNIAPNPNVNRPNGVVPGQHPGIMNQHNGTNYPGSPVNYKPGGPMNNTVPGTNRNIPPGAPAPHQNFNPAKGPMQHGGYPGNPAGNRPGGQPPASHVNGAQVEQERVNIFKPQQNGKPNIHPNDLNRNSHIPGREQTGGYHGFQNQNGPNNHEGNQGNS